jgi:thiosulfate reductase cytochrome b subunit
MKASTERKLLRWIHLITSIPIVGYIYGPVAEIPEAVLMIRFVLFPLVILAGLWMWKGMVVKKWFDAIKARGNS